MPTLNPSLLRLIAEGFEDDAYVADGNHLRWWFDPALGFPRNGFCLHRRPAVGTKHGFIGIDKRTARQQPGNGRRRPE